MVEYDEIENGELITRKVKISQCDTCMSFIDTISRGKKNDHVTHNDFLYHVINSCSNNLSLGLDMP